MFKKKNDKSYPFLKRGFFESGAENLSKSYVSAVPFPHIVIDDFLPLEMAETIANNFPSKELSSFEQINIEYQVNKLGRTQENDFAGVPDYIRHFLLDMNSKIMIETVEKITGISGLIPDPHFQGGALHQILPGGKLDVHADFNKHMRLNLDRRINLLLYLNKDWQESYGGHLELWDEKMKECSKRVLPIFNRCVIFSTTSTSYHGHPVPLTCPENRTRNSIALYYYSNGRPKEENDEAHATLWQERPDIKLED